MRVLHRLCSRYKAMTLLAPRLARAWVPEDFTSYRHGCCVKQPVLACPKAAVGRARLGFCFVRPLCLAHQTVLKTQPGQQTRVEPRGWIRASRSPTFGRASPQAVASGAFSSSAAPRTVEAGGSSTFGRAGRVAIDHSVPSGTKQTAYSKTSIASFFLYETTSNTRPKSPCSLPETKTFEGIGQYSPPNARSARRRPSSTATRKTSPPRTATSHAGRLGVAE